MLKLDISLDLRYNIGLVRKEDILKQLVRSSSLGFRVLIFTFIGPLSTVVPVNLILGPNWWSKLPTENVLLLTFIVGYLTVYTTSAVSFAIMHRLEKRGWLTKIDLFEEWPEDATAFYAFSYVLKVPTALLRLEWRNAGEDKTTLIILIFSIVWFLGFAGFLIFGGYTVFLF